MFHTPLDVLIEMNDTGHEYIVKEHDCLSRSKPI